MDLLEKDVGAVDDGSREVDPVRHSADLAERVEQGTVRAADLQQQVRRNK